MVAIDENSCFFELGPFLLPLLSIYILVSSHLHLVTVGSRIHHHQVRAQHHLNSVLPFQLEMPLEMTWIAQIFHHPAYRLFVKLSLKVVRDVSSQSLDPRTHSAQPTQEHPVP